MICMGISTAVPVCDDFMSTGNSPASSSPQNSLTVTLCYGNCCSHQEVKLPMIVSPWNFRQSKREMTKCDDYADELAAD